MQSLSWLGELILKSRWGFMALLGVLLIAYETTEHRPEIYQELDLDFLLEALLIGGILPLLGGISLTDLARARHERAHARQFSRRLDGADSW